MQDFVGARYYRALQGVVYPSPDPLFANLQSPIGEDRVSFSRVQESPRNALRESPRSLNGVNQWEKDADSSAL